MSISNFHEWFKKADEDLVQAEHWLKIAELKEMIDNDLIEPERLCEVCLHNPCISCQSKNTEICEACEPDCGVGSGYILCLKDSVDITFRNICFLAQQAVEKYIKAYMVYKGLQIQKTHNIKSLLKKVSEDLKLDSELKKRCEIISKYVSSRYPDSKKPNIEETLFCISTAKEIRKIIRLKIEELGDKNDPL